jgi:V8-like Glu-specific endopeptidase
MCDRIEVEGMGQDSHGRGSGDRPGDPLFPLMPRMLETIRARAQERMRAESRSELSADEYSMIIETICGAADDSQPVEQYNGALGVTQAFVAQRQSPVGQIQWNANLGAIYTNPGDVSGARWCSGTLIANDLFLTAGHCFDQTGGGWERPRVNGTSNIISSADIATNMHVNFNFQVDAAGNPRPEVSFPITALLEYRLGGLDFAIVRLGGNPGTQFGTTAISVTDAAQGDMCCIIGHPSGLPKRIEAGPALAPAGNQIRYDDIDTLGGNSGSGVLRASDGRIVGVHTNGGCGATSPNGVNANFGMRIAAVIAASPTLQNLTRPHTLIAADAPPGTTIFAADIGGTLWARDRTVLAADIGTFRSLDLGTPAARDLFDTRKGFDDLKTPMLDKAFSDTKPAASDFPVFDPGVIGRPFGSPLARPFVLATPHRAMAWTGEDQRENDLQSVEAMLQQTREAILQHEQALQALSTQYEQLAAEYQTLGGQLT